MNRINPRKLLLSKWTAARPENRERHFLVTELFHDETGTLLLELELQAVLTRRNQRIPWQQLQDAERWRMGWR
ncbi:tryptophan-rich conserved hypothetical protein [Pseudomonas asplenii]|uniref:TIGR02450 family Trp-rich protein n=1 Tax=Pseudomonas asplenii TaxID=53407 RepID=A0A0M9GKC8_9PSED|nr:TIGR02450 family Trp-rich protein [Pseudomonas fuscovaginae]KPA93456.1 tryptophan-rich conserved hypothetical protein [Pseudomonas fuscovaginae]